MKRNIIDEKCSCGHLRSQHADRFAKGHGPCNLCKCAQFTWVEFVVASVSPRSVEIDVEPYRRYSGHLPPRSGSGQWAFAPNFNEAGSSPRVFWYNGTFAEARKAAKAHFAALGWMYAAVLP